MKHVARSGWVFGVVLLAGAAFGQVSGYPPPPPRESPARDAFDFHVHSGPDVFSRSLDDIDVARLARQKGMRGLVLKNHVTSTADRAQVVATLVPGIEVFGGIVLNRAVGGVNPHAVEWMARMSVGRGRVVWLPTFEADHHLKSTGSAGEGLKVAVEGRVLPETEAVLRVVARENLVLQTGHVSPDEILAVLGRARELGVSSVVVTHAMATVPNLSLEQMKEVADLGGFLEIDYLSCLAGPHAHLESLSRARRVSIQEKAAAIRALGAAHVVLGTDLGQAGTPTHPDGLEQLITGLQNAGIGREDIETMARVNPARLLRCDSTGQ
jgi:hypothetical protein